MSHGDGGAGVPLLLHPRATPSNPIAISRRFADEELGVEKQYPGLLLIQ